MKNNYYVKSILSTLIVFLIAFVCFFALSVPQVGILSVVQDSGHTTITEIIFTAAKLALLLSTPAFVLAFFVFFIKNYIESKNEVEITGAQDLSRTVKSRGGNLVWSIVVLVIVFLGYYFLGFVGKRNQETFNPNSNCSSDVDYNCQSDYHLATFLPLADKATSAQDINICREAQKLQDYSIMWSESRCIAGVFQSSLPDIDGNISTNDYVVSIDGNHVCTLKYDSYLLSGLIKTKWSETDIETTKTINSGDSICFYEYQNQNEISKAIDNYKYSATTSSYFFNFDNILIQYKGNNIGIVNYLKEKVTPINYN